MSTTTAYALVLPRWDVDWRITGWKTDGDGRPVLKGGRPVPKKKRDVWDTLRGNSRPSHWGQRHKATKTVIEEVVRLARAQRIQPCKHVIVQLHWAPGNNRNADVDNLVHLQKVMADALARGRKDLPGLHLVPDDNDKHMTKLMPVIDRPPAEAGLWLSVVTNG